MDQGSGLGVGRLKSGAYTGVFESASGGSRAAIRRGGPAPLDVFLSGVLVFLKDVMCYTSTFRRRVDLMPSDHRHLNQKPGLIGVLFFFLLAGPILAESADRFPRPQGPVNDFADVISPEYEQKLTQVAAELLQKTGVAVVVATVPDIGGEDYNEYANRLYQAWGIGKKGEDKGVLLFVTIKERKMRIETGYGVEGIIPDGLAGEIRDNYMIPYLKQNRFGEGLLSGTLAIAGVIAKDAGVSLTGQAPMRRPARKRSKWSGLFGFLFFLLVLFSMGRGRRRGGLLPLLLLGSMGGRGGYGRGGFGGFGGGFGGFGGGMSGGGGAGGGF